MGHRGEGNRGDLTDATWRERGDGETEQERGTEEKGGVRGGRRGVRDTPRDHGCILHDR